MNRLQTHALLAEKLAGLSDTALAALVDQATPLHTGIGGSAKLLTFESSQIFVKQIPLTDLERVSTHLQSTANLFDLPLFCQYGLGGCPGFGAWRELAAHVIATNWVLNKDCSNFPLLYHWRVLSASKAPPMDESQRQSLNRDVAFWDNSSAVRQRLEAVYEASASLVLFCEYIPQNLLVWLNVQFKAGEAEAAAAIALVETHLGATIDFMNTRGFIHFDAHFENIMTDGRQLYFTDFGLATSTAFALSDAEMTFLTQHRGYDLGRAAVGFMHAISSSYLGSGPWKDQLREYLHTSSPTVPPVVADAVRKWAPVALGFLEFTRKLLSESKHTEFPTATIERLVAQHHDQEMGRCPSI